MQYRDDPKSGNKISVLGFGCMRFPKSFGGAIDMKKTESLVMRAIEQGVNYFDTARIYTGIEEALGTIVANNNVRNKIYVASKIPPWQIHSPRDIDKHFGLTLEKLQTDYLDYCFIHMLSEFATWEKLQSFGIEDWIAEKKQTGQIRQIGFSFHGQRDQFLKVLAAYNWDMTLIQYNYSNEHFQAGVTGLKAAHEKGIPVFIMEPLLGGRLVNDLPKEVRSIFRKTRPEWTAAGWGLNWLWNQREITMVLSGMNSEIQLEDNLLMADAAEVDMLTEADKAAFVEVRRIFNESYKIKCTGCAYCLPCPQEVNIPGCFAAYNTSFSMGLIDGLMKYAQGVSVTAKTMRNAGRCVDCGKCEQHCPQSLPIRKDLKLVKKRMEPFWFWRVLQLVRWAMKL